MIHVYTGNGKGKTTSSLGLIVRSLGHDKKVCLIQFMKDDWGYGEIKFLREQKNIDIYKFGGKDFVDPDNPSQFDIDEAVAGWEKAKEVLETDKYDLVVLDEINVVVFMKLLPLEKQIELMHLNHDVELVMTGRYASDEVIANADLVTEMKLIKHYYNKGVKSRQGIEF